MNPINWAFIAHMNVRGSRLIRESHSNLCMVQGML